MATSLLLLLDDIASVLDDVSVMTKVAMKKTAAVVGDDLALNAKQVTGVSPVRELPVVFAVARGSALNKAILVPLALLLSWLAPWAVVPVLMIGGAYLCYEGVEKLLHSLRHRTAAQPRPPLVEPADLRAYERRKIAGAVCTDFILSAEIIVITLGLVAGRPLLTQFGVLVAISVAMTIGVYGLVAAIVKLDDLGAMLALRPYAGSRLLGRAILAAAPWLMRALAVAGTLAMFLVGGGIVIHNLPTVHHAVHDWIASLADRAGLPQIAATVGGKIFDLLAGVVVGLAGVALMACLTAVRSELIRPASVPGEEKA